MTQTHGQNGTPFRGGVSFVGTMAYLSTSPGGARAILNCMIPSCKSSGPTEHHFLHCPIMLVQLKLRTVGQSIEIDVGVMRPGRGLNFVVGMVVDSVSSAGVGQHEVKTYVDFL